MRSFKSLCVFFLLLLAPVLASAEEEGFLEVRKDVPGVMICADPVTGKVSGWTLERSNKNSFTGFELGSSDIPADLQLKLKTFADDLMSNEYIFVQGRTDSTHWRNPYQQKEYDSMDLLLGLARGEKIVEFLESYKPEISKRIYLLDPVVVRDGRGVDVYIASYVPPPPEEIVLPEHDHDGLYSKIGHAHDYASKDHTHESPVPETSGSGLRMGVGGGFYQVEADSTMSFSVPTVNLYFVKRPFEVSLYTGWYPKDSEPVEGFGKTAESLVGGDLSVFFYRWLGISAGANCAWNFLRINDEYVERALGFYVGPRICIGGPRRYNILAGVNFQRSDVNRFEGFPEWENGYNVFASARVMFDFIDKSDNDDKERSDAK